VTDRAGTVDLLERGLTSLERKRLGVTYAGFNDRGEIAAELRGDPFVDQPELTRTVVYRPVSGWEELTVGEPEFEGVHVHVGTVNKRGDTILGTVEVLEEGGEEFRQFLYLANRTLFELPLFAVSLNNARQVVGVDYSNGESRRTAYYFSPQTGIIDLHPDGFAVSSAGGLFEDGAFLLSAREGKPKRNKWSLYSVDPELRRTLLYGWKDVRRFARKAGCRRQRLAEPLVQGFNRRGEIVGLLLCKGSPNRHFYFDPASGLELMQDLLDEAGRADVRPISVSGVNETGQILLNVTAGESITAALLTPDF